MKKTAILLYNCSLLLVLMSLLGVQGVAQQPPPLPHAFYGEVWVNGAPAPVGTVIEARGEGVRTGIAGNPITVTVAGKYGGPGGFDPKLLVQGQVAEGTPIGFYINGVRAECAEPGGAWLSSYPYRAGGITVLNLRVTVEGTGTPGLPTITATVPSTTGTPSVTATPTATRTATVVVTSTRPAATSQPAPVTVIAPASTPGPSVTVALTSTATAGDVEQAAGSPTATRTPYPTEVSVGSSTKSQGTEVAVIPSPIATPVATVKVWAQAQLSPTPAEGNTGGSSSTTVKLASTWIAVVGVAVIIVLVGGMMIRARKGR